MNEDLQNALAFYQPAPPGWFSSAQERIEAGGVWLWETLQGDFHDDPSTAQVVTGTVISMIPLVDQLCDVRDFIANCRKIEEDNSNTWAWVAMVLTLIGAVPVLGSLVKGCFKVLIQSARRHFHTALKSVERDAVALAIEQGLSLLKRYLDMVPVRKVLVRMKIHNIYQYLAEKIDELKGLLNVDLLLKGFATLMDTIRKLFDTIIDWGPASLRAPVEELWGMIQRIFLIAPTCLRKALEPTLNFLETLANRLRVEADGAYRARPGNNSHVLGNREAGELELLRQKKPDWVDEVETPKYKALKKLPKGALKKIADGWPDISASSKHKGLAGKFGTFDKSMRAAEVLPGERLYRVLDPSSGDNSICWMREAEFKALNSKSQWRREFAVWKHWNENGEYVIYTVPSGDPLKVWEGRAGSQLYPSDSSLQLEGGRVQIVLNPDQLDPKFVSARQKTGWGYDDGTGDIGLDPLKPYLGLPDLTHKWFIPKPK
ncbi:hypothetical protein PS870_05938 [Pseudomonas fluorescens]|uniref:Uncharacterized protein n=2 Tax=Pseudomonas fluorescens TaxID=294 RepID=A0A5E7Q9T9_PSEFL|nr:hypothetical protein PS870_05938 [Pseudomonas fluorescens]